jgi:hypothetical protein
MAEFGRMGKFGQRGAAPAGGIEKLLAGFGIVAREVAHNGRHRTGRHGGEMAWAG